MNESPQLAIYVLVGAKELVDTIKQETDTLSVNEANQIYTTLREAEGWLMSARQLLEPK